MALDGCGQLCKCILIIFNIIFAFSCLLAILAGVEAGAGVYAYIRSDEVGEQLAKLYMTVYAQYVNKGDPGLAATLSMFHNGLHCCGLIGALDLLVKKTCPETGFFETFTLPACSTVIINLFESKAPLMLGLFLGTAAALITAMVCCSILMKQIKKSHLSAPMY